MNLKKILPMEYLFWIKNFTKLLSPKHIESNGCKPRAYFLDTPEYGNLGDQAIAVAMRTFFEEKLPEYEIIDIQGDKIAHYLKSIKKSINPNDIVCLVGGGNMGSMYLMYEATRRILIKSFPNNKVIVFPQTIEYENSSYGRKELKKSISVYENNKNLILTIREKESFKRMKEYYPNSKVILCPDIVLFLSKDSENNKRSGVGLCLRNDLEVNLSTDEHNKIVQIIESIKLPVHQLTTTTTLKHIEIHERKNVILGKLEEFCKYELIVTDRLHGMIFAAITGTPAIIFKSKNQKIAGVYKWIENLPYIKLILSVDEMPQAINDVLHVDNCVYNNYCDELFEEVIDEIKR